MDTDTNLYLPDDQYRSVIRNLLAAKDHYDPENRVKEILSELGIVPESIRTDVQAGDAKKKAKDWAQLAKGRS